jgi:uridylate kinase
MNALFLRDALTVPSTVVSAVTIEGIAKHFNPVDVKDTYPSKVVIFAAGIGNPLFSTDTSAALRAIETECDCVIKLTDVGGVFTADPKRDQTATLIRKLTFDEVLSKRYSVMDLAAFCLCQEHNMPIIVTKLDAITSLSDLLDGKVEGTCITL